MCSVYFRPPGKTDGQTDRQTDTFGFFETWTLGKAARRFATQRSSRESRRVSAISTVVGTLSEISDKSEIVRVIKSENILSRYP